MKVQVIWEFDADVAGLDRKWCDVEGLAKDFAKREMEDLLVRGEITADDFEYRCVAN